MLFTLRLLHEKGHCWTMKIIIKPFSLIPCCGFNEEETNFLILNICFLHNLKYPPTPATILTFYGLMLFSEKGININSFKWGLDRELILNSWKGKVHVRAEFSESRIFLVPRIWRIDRMQCIICNQRYF